MKKEQLFIITILSVLLTVQFANTLDLQLTKQSYSPGETLQATLTGNFLSLSLSNIKIYKENLVHDNPVISDLIKQGDIYYYYAILPFSEGNYSLKIEDSRYTVNNEIKTDTIVKSFSILKTNSSYLAINPGFIMADSDFSVKIKSLNGNSNADIQLDSIKQNISLIDEVEKTIQLSVSGINSTTANLIINDYNIPVFISKTITPITISTSDLFFSPSKLEATLVSGKDYFFNVLIKNTGSKNISDISLTGDINAIISPDKISLLKPNQYAMINITIPSLKDSLSGKITASYGDKKTDLLVVFNITEEQKKENITGTSVSETTSCLKIGNICLGNEECNGQTTASLEGPCCIGSCIIPKKTNYTFYFGIILAIILVLFIIYYYFRLKKRQKPKSTDEMLREKSERYKQRTYPNSREVSGNLKRV